MEADPAAMEFKTEADALERAFKLMDQGYKFVRVCSYEEGRTKRVFYAIRAGKGEGWLRVDNTVG